MEYAQEAGSQARIQEPKELVNMQWSYVLEIFEIFDASKS